MAKFMKLEAKGKEYLIGFSNRASVLNAKKLGLEKIIKNLDEKETDINDVTVKLLRFGLLEKNPDITEKEAGEILDSYIEDCLDNGESADITQIINFLGEQYTAFSGLPSSKMKNRVLKIVEM